MKLFFNVVFVSMASGKVVVLVELFLEGWIFLGSSLGTVLLFTQTSVLFPSSFFFCVSLSCIILFPNVRAWRFSLSSCWREPTSSMLCFRLTDRGWIEQGCFQLGWHEWRQIWCVMVLTYVRTLEKKCDYIYNIFINLLGNNSPLGLPLSVSLYTLAGTMDEDMRNFPWCADLADGNPWFEITVGEASDNSP